MRLRLLRVVLSMTTGLGHLSLVAGTELPTRRPSNPMTMCTL